MRERTDAEVKNAADGQQVKDAIGADIDAQAVECIAWVTRTDTGFRFLTVGYPDGRQQLMGYLESLELPEAGQARH